MNIYLDISGTLLRADNTLAFGAETFLQYIGTHWPNSTYWLSSYSWRGKDRAFEVLEPHVTPKTRKLIKQFRSANWIDSKTDGIDFSTPFLWFDDNLFPEEKQTLIACGALDCHRHIRLQHDPHQLADELDYLKSLA